MSSQSQAVLSRILSKYTHIRHNFSSERVIIIGHTILCKVVDQTIYIQIPISFLLIKLDYHCNGSSLVVVMEYASSSSCLVSSCSVDHDNEYDYEIKSVD